MRNAAAIATRTGSRDVVYAQLDQCYRQLPVSLAVNLTNGLLLVFVLWKAIDTPALLVWFCVLAVVTAARGWTLYRYHQVKHVAALNADTWRRYFVVGACAAGWTWGMAAVLLFHPYSFAHQIFLAAVLGGMVAGAIPLLSAVTWAYPCFAIPVVIPISLQMLLVGDEVHVILSLMMMVYGIAMLVASGRVHKLFDDSERLRLRLSSSIETSHALQQMLRIDVLTGIANRRMFEESLLREWRRASRENEKLSIVTADIDHFKEYNDFYGHPAGDTCLIAVAQTLSSALSRPGDVAARIGGEEFAVLLPGTPLDGAVSVAHQIREQVAALNLSHEASPVANHVTLSIGVACSDNPAISSTADLLRTADAALYDAKRRGRNRVAVIAD